MEFGEMLKQEEARNKIRLLSLKEGIIAYQRGFFANDCPYDHSKPYLRVYDVSKPNVYLDESQMRKGVHYRWELPPIEYEKAEAWKRGWLIAYWFENMEKRKAYIAKIRSCIDHLKLCANNYYSNAKLTDTGVIKNLFNRLTNFKKLKHLEEEFYNSPEYTFLDSLHIEGILRSNGRVDWFDAFLNITRKYEKILGISPAQEYLFRLSEDIDEVGALIEYYNHERNSEKYKLKL